MLRSRPSTKALKFGKEEEEGGLSDSGDSLSAVHPAIRVDLTPSPSALLPLVCLLGQLASIQRERGMKSLG